MANEGDFQDQVRQLGKLIAEFDGLPEGAAKIAAKQLIHLLMDVHGAGLERMMEIVFDSGSMAPGIIDKFGQDSMVGSLLILYSLHPDDLETRVLKALERMRVPLRKLDCTAQLLSVHEGAVQVRVKASGHSHVSMTKDLRSLVEEGVYQLAPDVSSLTILGLEEPPAAGFVALESLVGHRLAVPVSSSHALETEGAD